MAERLCEVAVKDGVSAVERSSKRLRVLGDLLSFFNAATALTPASNLHGRTSRGKVMSQNPETFNPFDPTGMFKTMRDSNVDVWSKMMIQLVNSDPYAQATGTMLDAWLSS